MDYEKSIVEGCAQLLVLYVRDTCVGAGLFAHRSRSDEVGVTHRSVCVYMQSCSHEHILPCFVVLASYCFQRPSAFVKTG